MTTVDPFLDWFNALEERFMRTLTNVGILALGDDEFSLTSLGERLRSNGPGSVRSGVLSIS